MKKIILIPAYEPDKKLSNLVDKIDKKEFEIIVVDDGSGKDYDNIFDNIDKKVKVIRYENNKGKGYALKTGFRYIRDKYHNDYIVITMDSDGQHRIEDAIKLSDYLLEHRDILVLGKRLRGKNTPLRSKFGNVITKIVYNFITGVNVYDTQTGLRAFSDELMDLMLEISGDRFDYEMNQLLEVSKRNIKIKEIEIKTIYIDNNKGTHFRAIKDSYLVYKDIIKFSLSSILSSIVDYIFYVIFNLTLNSIILSNIMARIISASVNYNVNKRVVFKSKKRIYKSLWQYILLAFIILILNTLILNVLVNIIGINKYIGKIMVEIILFVISYKVQKKIIFKE